MTWTHVHKRAMERDKETKKILSWISEYSNTDDVKGHIQKENHLIYASLM